MSGLARGFTLIELIVVVALLCSLGTFCAFQSIGSFQRVLANIAIEQDDLVNASVFGHTYRHIQTTN